MEFKSSTDCVKSIIMNFMDGKDVVDRKEIVEAIRADSEGALVSEGVIAGSFKILVAQGYITPVQRGVYKKTGEEYQAGSSRRTTYEKKDVFDNIEGIVKKFDRDLDKACTINPLNLDEEQRQKYSQTVDCLAYMRGSVHICAKELEGILHPKETNIDVEKEAALLREAFGLEAVQKEGNEETWNEEQLDGNVETPDQETSKQEETTSEEVENKSEESTVTSEVEKPVDDKGLTEKEEPEKEEPKKEEPKKEEPKKEEPKKEVVPTEGDTTEKEVDNTEENKEESTGEDDGTECENGSGNGKNGNTPVHSNTKRNKRHKTK